MQAQASERGGKERMTARHVSLGGAMRVSGISTRSVDFPYDIRAKGLQAAASHLFGIIFGKYG